MIREFGDSKVRLGDIHDKSEIYSLLNGIKAKIFYSDPPWGDGNIKYWDTMNKKMNGIFTSTGNFDIDVFLDHVLDYAVNFTDGWVVIEYGNRWVDKVKEKAKNAGLHYCDSVETLYGSKKKPYTMQVMFFRTDKPLKIDLSTIHHTINNQTVQAVFDLLFSGHLMEGEYAIDTSCGLGLTAKAALSHNMNFIGNELNATRIQKTYARFK